MKGTWTLAVLVIAGCAALRPGVGGVRPPTTAAAEDAAWPERFEGATLHQVPLLASEAQFAAGFPGSIAAFEGEGGRVVMRHVTQPTRRLHPAQDCLRAAGFRVQPRPALRHPVSGLWSVLLATRDGRTYRVRERIVSADGTRAWTDVSAWFWSALVQPESGPWVSTLVIEPAAAP